MNKAPLSILMTAALLLTQGCGNRIWEDGKDTASSTYDYVFDTAPTARSYHDTAEIPVIELNYRAADTLYANVARDELTPDSALFVRRFVNRRDPGDNAVFGYVMAEQIADRLVQDGMLVTEGEPNVTDFNYGPGVTPDDYRKAGSNVAGTFKPLPPRAAKLTGSYVVGENYVYMTAKVVRLVDSAVVSAHNWVLPVTDNIRQMLPQLRTDDGLSPTVRTSFGE